MGASCVVIILAAEEELVDTIWEDDNNSGRVIRAVAMHDIGLHVAILFVCKVRSLWTRRYIQYAILWETGQNVKWGSDELQRKAMRVKLLTRQCTAVICFSSFLFEDHDHDYAKIGNTTVKTRQYWISAEGTPGDVAVDCLLTGRQQLI